MRSTTQRRSSSAMRSTTRSTQSQSNRSGSGWHQVPGDPPAHRVGARVRHEAKVLLPVLVVPGELVLVELALPRGRLGDEGVLDADGEPEGAVSPPVRHHLTSVTGARASSTNMPDCPTVSATILDGKATAAAIRSELKVRVAALRDQGVVPGLGTVLVGDDPGSQSYVAGKHRDCAEVGPELAPARAARRPPPRPTSRPSSTSSTPTRPAPATSCSCRCRRGSTPTPCSS